MRHACHAPDCCLVLGRLDHCSALLGELSNGQTNILQQALNLAARLINCVRWRGDITRILQSLHWLPSNMGITFKMCTDMCLAWLSPGLPEVGNSLQRAYSAYSCFVISEWCNASHSDSVEKNNWKGQFCGGRPKDTNMCDQLEHWLLSVLFTLHVLMTLVYILYLLVINCSIWNCIFTP